MARRRPEIDWNQLDAHEWQRRMEELMAKPIKGQKALRESDFVKAMAPSRIQTQRVIQFFDPLPADVKRASVDKFRAYLERQRRARKAAAKTTGATKARRRQAGR